MPRRDLVRTLEDLGMPDTDLQKWDRWFANVDSATTKFSGGNVLNVSHIEADTGRFNVSPPLSCAAVKKIQLSCANGVATAVEFASLEYNHGGIIDYAVWAADKTKVYIAGSRTNRIFLLSYYQTWDANVTGVRRLLLNIFDKDDSSTSVIELSYINATLGGFVTSASGAHTVKFGADDRYIKLYAYQNSGGALDVNVEMGLIWTH